MSDSVLIGSSSPPDRGSGINAYVNSIATAMHARGITVLYAAPAAVNPAHITNSPFQHIPIGQSDSPVAATRQLLDALNTHQVRLIINNDNPYLQAIAPWVNCVFIAVGHMARTNVATLACHNSEWVDYMVAISNEMQRHFITHRNLDPSRVPIIYNGVVDPHAGQLLPRKEHAALTAVFAGGSGRNKGADLLEAAVRKNGLPDGMTLHWFGHLTQRAYRRLSQLPQVVVHGRVPRADFIATLSNADLFLLPSRSEGCPMAMLEAMSYGVIPLASDGRGAMQRIIIHGQEGFICRLSHWSEDMQHCMARLAACPQLITDMRQQTYQRFLSDFTIDTTVDQLLTLGRRPICDRLKKPQHIRLLKWHRPMIAGTFRAPLLDRLAIRAGFLRRDARCKFDDIVAHNSQ